MKYTYKFVTGESVGIEVSAELEALLKNEDRMEYNSDHANTRRHVSINMAEDAEGMQFTDPATMPPPEYTTRLLLAFDALRKDQQELVRAIYFDGLTISEYADSEGVSQAAISQRLQTVQKKLRKILSDPYI